MRVLSSKFLHNSQFVMYDTTMKIRDYYQYKFIQHLVPIFPIYSLLFASRGLSVSQISLLLAIWSVPVVILEVPTGLIADHWNRRKMLVVATLLKALCYLLWLIADGFFLFAVGFVCWGVAEAFCSGSEEALLYDTLILSNQEHEFDRIYGKGLSFASIAVGISCLTGGFLADFFGMKFVLILSVSTSLLTTLATLRFCETNLYLQSLSTNHPFGVKDYLTIIRDAAYFCFSRKFLFLVLLLMVGVVAMAGLIDEYDPLIASSFGLNLSIIGIWVGARNLIEAIGSTLAYRLKRLSWFRLQNTFVSTWTLAVVAGISIGLFALFNTLIAAPLYALFYLLLSMAMVLQEEYLQREIREQARSTVHSLVSLAMNLYGILLFGILAAILFRREVKWILFLCSIYVLVIAIVLALAYYSTVCRNRTK